MSPAAEIATGDQDGKESPMKAKAATLTTGIGMTLALIAPAAQAAVVWGDGAAATPSTLTVKAATNHRAHSTTTHTPNYQALKNSI
jgi:hypothetical protein